MKQSRALNALASLSSEHRLQTMRQLIAAGKPGMAAGDIAASLEIGASRLSFHLSALESAGLVRSERQGRRILYRADFAAMRDLISYLMVDCCGGHPDICPAGPVADHSALGIAKT